MDRRRQSSSAKRQDFRHQGCHRFPKKSSLKEKSVVGILSWRELVDESSHRSLKIKRWCTWLRCNKVKLVKKKKKLAIYHQNCLYFFSSLQIHLKEILTEKKRREEKSRLARIKVQGKWQRFCRPIDAHCTSVLDHFSTQSRNAILKNMTSNGDTNSIFKLEAKVVIWN